MTREEIIEELVDGYIRHHEEHPCDHFGQVCPNYINQTCTCNYDYADCEKYVKNLLTNGKQYGIIIIEIKERGNEK